jgi:hypothetical protein
MAYIPGDSPEERAEKIDEFLVLLRAILLQAEHFVWTGMQPVHQPESERPSGYVRHTATLDISILIPSALAGE